MEILIYGRHTIEKVARKPFNAPTAVISIADVGDDFAMLENTPKYLHCVSFDDVDNDVIVDELGSNGTAEQILAIEKKYKMFSTEQATEIARFYFSVSDKVDCIICQCEHGQSRSAAVAAAIIEFQSKNGISVFADDNYYPNKVVFRRILSALREYSSTI